MNSDPTITPDSPPVVCVQGLGFVGLAMALATASARRPDGSPAFEVVGVELDNEAGRRRVETVNDGRLPIISSDPRMQAALTEAVSAGNLRATTDPGAYESAEVAIVDIGLDVTRTDAGPTVDFRGLRGAVRALASRLPAGALMIVETTVPPGTCATVVAPEACCARSGADCPRVPFPPRRELRPHEREAGRRCASRKDP